MLRLTLLVALVGCDKGEADSDADTDADSDCAASVWHLDADGDGYGDPTEPVTACAAPTGYTADGTDCDDARALVHPDRPEQCDGVDEDCDGTVDDGASDATTWWYDGDGDGHGDPASGAPACEPADGWVATSDDCDDSNAAISPSASERCDGVDEDCDGSVDDGAMDARTFWLDADADGHGDPAVSTVACSAPAGWVGTSDDCVDSDSGIFPSAIERCDGVDEDCDGAVDEDAADAVTVWPDADGDDYGDPWAATAACELVAGYVANELDCDDGDAGIHPLADEICDGADQDCDGVTDEDPVDGADFWSDADGDGFGASPSIRACADPTGYVTDSSDCDDTDFTISPTSIETCDGVDEDCDGATDEDAEDATTFWLDADGDGYGDAGTGAVSCAAPSGFVANDEDCDDTDASRSPAVLGYVDADGDGFGSEAASSCDSGAVSDGTDCDDADAAIHPSATDTPGDGVDADCDGADGWSDLSCEAPDASLGFDALCAPYLAASTPTALFVPTGSATADDVTASFVRLTSKAAWTTADASARWSPDEDGDLVFCDDGAYGRVWLANLDIDHAVRVSDVMSTAGRGTKYRPTFGVGSEEVNVTDGGSLCVPDVSGKTLEVVVGDVTVDSGSWVSLVRGQHTSLTVAGRYQTVYLTDISGTISMDGGRIDSQRWLRVKGAITGPGSIEVESALATDECVDGVDLELHGGFIGYPASYGVACISGDTNLLAPSLGAYALRVDASGATGPTTVEVSDANINYTVDVTGSPYGTTVTLDNVATQDAWLKYGDTTPWTFTDADVTIRDLQRIPSSYGAPATRWDIPDPFRLLEVHGGSLSCERCTLDGGIVDGSDVGGAALYAEDSDISFTDSTFAGNYTWHAYDGTDRPPGGAISTVGGTLSIDGGTFTDNWAYSGGAITCSGTAVTIADSTFDGNTAVATRGGAIELDDTSTLTLQGGSFDDNEAATTGGAIAGGDTISATTVDFGTNPTWSVDSNSTQWEPGLAATFTCGSDTCSGSGI